MQDIRKSTIAKKLKREERRKGVRQTVREATLKREEGRRRVDKETVEGA